jgi:hypothetical protein
MIVGRSVFRIERDHRGTLALESRVALEARRFVPKRNRLYAFARAEPTRRMNAVRR